MRTVSGECIYLIITATAFIVVSGRVVSRASPYSSIIKRPEKCERTNGTKNAMRTQMKDRPESNNSSSKLVDGSTRSRRIYLPVPTGVDRGGSEASIGAAGATTRLLRKVTSVGCRFDSVFTEFSLTSGKRVEKIGNEGNG